jgi:hypothetical protein
LPLVISFQAREGRLIKNNSPEAQAEDGKKDSDFFCGLTADPRNYLHRVELFDATGVSSTLERRFEPNPHDPEREFFGNDALA